MLYLDEDIWIMEYYGNIFRIYYYVYVSRFRIFDGRCMAEMQLRYPAYRVFKISLPRHKQLCKIQILLTISLHLSKL